LSSAGGHAASGSRSEVCEPEKSVLRGNGRKRGLAVTSATRDTERTSQTKRGTHYDLKAYDLRCSAVLSAHMSSRSAVFMR
jgi:hypothetical protein